MKVGRLGMQGIVVTVALVLLAFVVLVAALRAVDPDSGSDDPASGGASATTLAPLPATEATLATTTTTMETTTTALAPRPGSSATPPSTVLDPPDFDAPMPEQTQQQVGQDIEPGRYLAESPNLLCYWERLSGPARTEDEIIVNGMLSGEHVIVEVLPTDNALYGQGCGPWRPYAPPARATTTFTDGDWLVGSDIPAGIYTARNGIHSAAPCRWERASGFTHAPDEILAHEYPGTVPLRVELHDGERFTTDSCGYWHLAG